MNALVVAALATASGVAGVVGLTHVNKEQSAAPSVPAAKVIERPAAAHVEKFTAPEPPEPVVVYTPSRPAPAVAPAPVSAPAPRAAETEFEHERDEASDEGEHEQEDEHRSEAEDDHDGGEDD